MLPTECRLQLPLVPAGGLTAHLVHQETCHKLFLDSYELKVEKEPRIQEKLIAKFIFRSEARKTPLFFFEK